MKKPLAKLTGNNTSLWGNTKGKEFLVNEFGISYSTLQEDIYFLSLDAYGPNLDWQAYTDRKIEKDIQTAAAKYLKSKKFKLKTLSWSEQGMQNDGKWNFDVKAFGPVS